MQVVNAKPPNYEDVLRVFPFADKPGVIFTFGDTVYAPGQDDIAPSLHVHEQVHSNRQLQKGVEEWWDEYLKDAQFRYTEELLAHRAEYAYFINFNRNQRRAALKYIAQRLSSKLYGNIVSLNEAKKAIRKGV